MLSGAFRAVATKATSRAVCVTPYVVQRCVSSESSHIKTAQAFENISGKYFVLCCIVKYISVEGVFYRAVLHCVR